MICLERGHGGYGGNVGDQWDAIDPSSHQPTQNACFASGWSVLFPSIYVLRYIPCKSMFQYNMFFAKFLFVSRYDKINGIITNFINQTGLSMVETDGPYGGETCASTTHDHHASNDDSIYWQTRLQVRHPPMCRIRV